MGARFTRLCLPCKGRPHRVDPRSGNDRGQRGEEDVQLPRNSFRAVTRTSDRDLSHGRWPGHRGLDNIGTTGTLQFMPAFASRYLSMRIIGDTAFEPPEQFTVELTSPTAATLGCGTATGTIVNDDDSVAVRGVTATMFAVLAAERGMPKPKSARRH